MFRTLRLFLPLLLWATAAAAAMPMQDALASLPNVAFPAPQRVAAGALDAGDVAALQRAGIREVVNLRPASETPGFDEAAALQAAGIAYRNLPIAGAADLDRANVARFDRLLREAGAAPTLVHCASGNRVGAMIALRAVWIEGRPVDAALAEGRRWGLKSLEPAVRAKLQAASGEAPHRPATAIQSGDTP